jgi:hypothetical protein
MFQYYSFAIFTIFNLMDQFFHRVHSIYPFHLIYYNEIFSLSSLSNKISPINQSAVIFYPKWSKFDTKMGIIRLLILIIGFGIRMCANFL